MSKSNYYSFWEISCQASISEERERNFEIGAIFNKFKETLVDLINSPCPECLPRASYEILHNAPKSQHGSRNIAKKNCLNKDVLASDRSLQLYLQTQGSKLYLCRNIFFGHKSRKTHYKKSEKQEKAFKKIRET